MSGSPNIDAVLEGSPYQSYLYAYPHKTAYRRLEPPVPLDEAWADQRREALFLYLHVPFCEMRCGFCNLFTASRPGDELVEAYMDALERQVRQVSAAVGPARYTRVALGGGTPTWLDPAQLERAFELLERGMGADLAGAPVGVEVSPATSTPERLDVLRERGVDRVSIGVQSFLDHEVASVLRPQKVSAVARALDRIRERGFQTLNVDLIYGIDGQTPRSLAASLDEALRWRPEEVYLYPLYVRPLTGLGRRADPDGAARWDAHRLTLYRAGRAHLLERGYRQVSMRMFRRLDAADIDGPVYRCQEDGMVGLGCGARSYTAALHYSTEYAVGAKGVREIIAAFVRRPDAAFARADWGFRLDRAEQKRRWLILSLLADGVVRADWTARFGGAVDEDFPELARLVAAGLASDDGAAVALTPAGVERADAVGPWLHSRRVQDLMDDWELR